MGKGPGSREQQTAKLNLGVAAAAEWDGRLARLFHCTSDRRSFAKAASFLAVPFQPAAGCIGLRNFRNRTRTRSRPSILSVPNDCWRCRLSFDSSAVAADSHLVDTLFEYEYEYPSALRRYPDTPIRLCHWILTINRRSYCRAAARASASLLTRAPLHRRRNRGRHPQKIPPFDRSKQ
jgi:hypothetical protein